MRSTFSGAFRRKRTKIDDERRVFERAVTSMLGGCSEKGAARLQKTVFETSFDLALSAPVESTAEIAKYQVPGVRLVV